VPTAETIDWEDCGDRTQCGTVEVPADYDDPAAGTINIAVNVHRATDLDERVGYLFINPGGPGGSGVDFVDLAESTFTGELLESFDIVGFDPRGVGASEPTFACGGEDEQADLLAQLDATPDTDEEIAIGSEAAQLCLESMGPVGFRLHSEFVARDMDEIRTALGAEQISYLGFSYGSALGGWYASLFPERVFSMAVDGAANPLASFETVEEAIEQAQASVGPLHDQLAAAIGSCDSTCPIWNDGDPEGYWYGMVDKFDLVTEAKDGDPTAIVLGVVGHLYSETAWPMLHESIFLLGENDDPSGFVAAIERASFGDGPSIVAHINCLDGWALFPELDLEARVARADAVRDEVDAFTAEQYPLLDAVELPEQAGSCIFYGAFDPPVFDGTYDGGGIPILVVGNTSDPVTPFIRSEQFATEVLADGRLVKVEHSSHVVYPGNPCINDLIHTALIDQEYPTEELTCEAVVGLGEISLVPVEFPDGAMSVRPAGWTELAPGAYVSEALGALVVFQPTGGDVQGTIGLIESQAGGSTAERVGEVDINGVTWSIFAINVPAEDAALQFAISPGPDGVMVLGQSGIDDIDELASKVLRPAIEAFVPAG